MLYFRDEQAVACSFFEKGDRVSVSAFIVEANPSSVYPGDQCPETKPLIRTQRVLVCAPDAVITVRSMQGDEPLLLTLRPGRYDQPEARVFLPTSTQDTGKVYANSTGNTRALVE
eukprot:TRINITY_DN8110_c0_g1_i1.p2 TRINITY_DN8110_c0_g1~~TRINITY_DN8110_c0_g1_i1.p2  ORF type:complete len:115 (+),score=31.16 TRINITY_DN8110_c0_g1_i1:541-885(+)